MEESEVAITGGFGVMVDTQRGTTRSWYMNRDGVKRWADNDAPCDALPEESLPADWTIIASA